MRRLIQRFIPLLAVLLLASSLSPPASAAPTCFGKPATITGSPRGDRIRGTSGNDVIVTFGGRDQINGEGGNDRICSGRGNDYVRGSDGHDRIKGGGHRDVILPERGRDRVYGNRGSDSIAAYGRDNDLVHGGIGSDWVTYDLSRRVWVDLRRGLARWNGRDTLRSIENVRGTGGRDVLRGNGAANYLSGGHAGNDVIAGRRGNDVLVPADPVPDKHVRVYGGGGFDVVDFEQTRRLEVDLLSGRVWFGNRKYLGHGTGELHSIESVVGSGHNDLIRGSDGEDHLAGGRGADVLMGRAGDDVLFGEDGSDIVIGDAGTDILDGGTGQDFVAFSEGVVDVVVDLLWGIVTSSHGEDTTIAIEGAYGTPESDELRGNDEANVFFGLGGDDFLQGAAGADHLDGGEGSDEADGGDDEDTCIGIETPTNCEHLEP